MDILVGEGIHRPWILKALGNEFKDFIFKRNVSDTTFFLQKGSQPYKAEIVRATGWGVDEISVGYKHLNDYCNKLVLGPPEEVFFPVKNPKHVFYSCRSCSQVIDVL
jgi:hypothetical protein